MIPELAISEVGDSYIRKNFERIRDFFKTEPNLDGFRALELTFTAPVVSKKIKHGLKFQPKDIITTSKTGDGTVTFNYSKFTATELDITIGGTVTTAAPVVIRFLVGTLQGVVSA